MKSARLLLILGCLGSLLACGDLGDDENTPLAVIEGQLSQASLTATPSNVRVAVIWNTSTTGFKTSMDVAASPVFPSKFRLELKDPPPVTATVKPSEDAVPDPTTDNPGPGGRSTKPLNNQGASAAYAIGSIVAYEDLDGDGRLGLIDANTPPSDRVLGTNEELFVVYVEGDPSAASPFGTPAPARGYNLYRSPRCTRPTRTSPGECAAGSWLPISTPYELPLGADPQLGELMCNGTSSSIDVSPNVQVDPKPAPGPNGWPDRNDPHLACKADGQSYAYFRCVTTSKGLCKGAHERCYDETWTLPSTPAPAEWPCTIE